MNTLLYLVGPPGVGKSTLMAEITAGLHRVPYSGPVPHDGLYRRMTPPETARSVGVEIGKRRESFSGTDALGMAVQPKAVEWIARRPHALVLGEGARLGTVGFLHAARSAGYRVIVVHLDSDEATLAARRLQRGSRQNEQWVRGATTRARRLAERMELDAEVHWLDGTMDPAGLAAEVRRMAPELEALCLP
jgi:ribose 1,5-bisphosphokinase PhnN